ncbi:MAG: ChaN family lipoprotein [Chromatiales bacterium]|nr:ChaN family lipoprotein [Chromatiales bacterium]
MTIKRYLVSATLTATVLMLWGCNAVSHKAAPHPHAMPGKSHATQKEAVADVSMMAVDLRNANGLESILPALFQARVVFVGEQHDNYGHHLAQLEVIKRLHQRNPNIAIGMEMFQRPFQQYLDDYLAGRISEIEMLRKTEWYERWRFDYRLYQPILSYAKEHKLPVIALNLQREITRKVSQGGIEGLTAEEKNLLPPEVDKSDKAYEGRLRSIFGLHPNSEKRNFDYFVESQLLWDETMAEQVANYLQDNPQHQMVVVAGNGHLMYGSGIPNRVTRRINVERAIVLPGDAQKAAPDVADFLIYPPDRSLPKAGLMGLLMNSVERGISVEEVIAGSGAEKAGLKKGDLLTQIDGQTIKSATDVRLQMLNKKPGDKIQVSVIRKKLLFGEEAMDVEIELGE